jgi:hypothetical protein
MGGTNRTYGVDLVDEQDDAVSRLLNLSQNGLQSVLEFTSKLSYALLVNIDIG